MATYKPKVKHPQKVEAVRLEADFVVGGKVIAKRGDWFVVSHDGKVQKFMTDRAFRNKYELDDFVLVTPPFKPYKPFEFPEFPPRRPMYEVK